MPGVKGNIQHPTKMERDSLCGPTDATDAPVTGRRRKGASYRPNYSQRPLLEQHEHRRRAEPGSWAPNTSQPHTSPPRKRRKFSPPRSNFPSVNPLKSKIRDLTRALQHSDLPADVRVEKERALAGYKQDLEEVLEEKRKRELIGRYHMLATERQKATRHVKKTQKTLSSTLPGSVDRKQLEEQLHIFQVDLNYTLYYPLNQKYEAIYPRQEDGNNVKSDFGEVNVKSEAWKAVEKCMEDGTLDALRDGSLDIILGVGQLKPRKKKGQDPKSHKQDEIDFGSKPSMTGSSQVKDEDSDGGFFEEDGGGTV